MKMICKNRGVMVVDWIKLAKISVLWQLLVNTVIKFLSPKNGTETGYVVGIMTELRTVGSRVQIWSRTRDLSLLQSVQERLWDPPRLPINGYRGYV